MKRLWLVVGFGLGALFVWSLLRSDQKLAQRTRAQGERLKPLAKIARAELAEESAIDGVDYTSEEWRKQELSKYKDDFDAIRRGDYFDAG